MGLLSEHLIDIFFVLGTRSAIMRNNDVFPTPLGPKRQVHSFFSRVKSIFLKSSVDPRANRSAFIETEKV